MNRPLTSRSPPLTSSGVDERVVLSNGFGKFFLTTAAAQLQDVGLDVHLLTGAYPPQWLERLPAFSSKLDRLRNRAEALERSRVTTLWAPEVLSQVAHAVRGKFPGSSLHERLDAISMVAYAKAAAGRLNESPTNFRGAIYHFRAGFGLSSLKVAKQLGMVTLCDHSIAHPEILRKTDGIAAGQGPVWDLILSDIDSADHVVVNSDYVKRTFEDAGWSHEDVSVAYWGVDDQFLGFIRQADQPSKGSQLRLLFAGTFESRKGARELLRALELFEADCSVAIAGSVHRELREPLHEASWRDDRLQVLGNLSRRELAREMVRSDVFVFPTRAEGSARVVFEALAAGCFVVTTAEAGSVVEDGATGRIIPREDPDALAGALREISSMPIDEIHAAGREASNIIRTRYRQEDYARALMCIYRSLNRPS